MNCLIGMLTLLLPVTFTQSYNTSPNGCSSTKNDCFFNVDCVGYMDNPIHVYSASNFFLRRRTVYGDYGESDIETIYPNGCSPDEKIVYNGNSYVKIHLKFKQTTPNDSDQIPNIISHLYDNQSPAHLIEHLDLSDNEYNYPPNLRAMEHLTLLNISNNFLTTARLYNQIELPALIDLDLSYNMINTIEVSPSDGVYKNLKKLNLTHNYLVSIPDAILDTFTQLEMLDLSHNYIDSLSISTFEGIKKLQILYLSHNRITDINYSFFRFSDLITLDMSHNRLETLKLHDFEKLSKLRQIDMSSNSIVSIESTLFWNMNSLVSLNLHDNKLKVIHKDTFANASSLKAVDISENRFNVLPRGLFKGKYMDNFAVNGNSLEGSLTSGMFEGLGLVDSLDLSNQQLTNLEDNAFLGLENIETLLLNNNKIQTMFKNCFRNLRKLNTLDLSYNNITDINFDAQDLVNLRSIVLRNNFLTQIKHENFIGLNTLQFLDLSNNKISKLQADSFKSLSELVNFKVSNNPLTGSLEERTFDGLNSLPSLVISGTELTTIKNSSFTGMTQLKQLNMSQSKINELQYNAFMNTGAVEEIDLSLNKLSTFNINSTDLKNLHVLLLNKNFLKSISQFTFSGFSRISTLNLAHNNINDIHEKAFGSQTDLVELNLSYNLDIEFNDTYISENTNLRNLVLSGIRNVSFTTIESTQLVDLDICYSGLINISAVNLKKLSRLEIINLSNNDAVRLDVGAFTNVTQLRHLDASYNKLTFIQPGIFKDNPRLRLLNISHNSLTSISYGIFRGLIYLNTLDISYNKITSLESERFYEVRSLSMLIVDHNKIDSLNAEDFVGTSLTTLSIGENPLPCEILVNFKKISVPFEVTAIKINEHSAENVDGVTCNMNGYTFKRKSNTSNDESTQTLYDIKEILSKMTQQQSVPIKTINNDFLDTQNMTMLYIMNISKTINKLFSKNDNKLSNSSITIDRNTKQNNMEITKLLEKILSTLERKSVLPTTPFPISKDNATNDLIVYVNKVKEDLLNDLAFEKQNILIELENKFAALNKQAPSPTTFLNTPVHNKLLATKEETQVTDTSSLFTETCVALILVILLCLVLYKFYKSRMLVRVRRSYSTRELPGAMESQNL